MRRVLVLLSALALLLAIPVGANAGSHQRTVITGGGIAQNDNSGAGNLLGIGGFVAHQNAVAKGQIQVKTIDASGDLVSQLHGTVVCVAETTSVDEGGQGYEIRFQVTRSSGPGAAIVGVDDYGSIYVQDNGKDDMVDEQFDDPTNPDCGDNDDDVSWEPLLRGNIKVRD